MSRGGQSGIGGSGADEIWPGEAFGIKLTGMSGIKSLIAGLGIVLGMAASAWAQEGAAETKITFLGSASAVPGKEPGEDTACFVINGSLLIDCGWNAAIHMQQYGLDPIMIDTLFITHCHHDHYMGLPALMFVRGMRRGEAAKRPPIRIIGPEDDLPIVVELTKKFLQAERFPEVWPAIDLKPLKPGFSFQTEAWSIQTIKAIHAVTGMCGKFTDAKSGVVIAFSGDTSPNAKLAILAKGADLLIHEASVPSSTPDDRLWDGHSRATDAARTAKEAGVKQLVLIHLTADQREKSLKAAKAIFENTVVAKEGETITLKGRSKNAP